MAVGESHMLPGDASSHHGALLAAGIKARAGLRRAFGYGNQLAVSIAAYAW
jgi:hypothetical protein